MDTLVIFAVFYPIAVIAVGIALLRDQNQHQLSCPKCDRLCKIGARPISQVVAAIALFPFGLLTFLAGRGPTACKNCGHRWMV